MKTLEQRMKALEEMIAEIHAVTVMGQAPAPPGAEEYKRAIEAMVDGDTTRLSLYLKRGGQVYKAETIYGPAAMLRGRDLKSGKRSTRAANHPLAATTPSSSPGP